MTKRLLLNNGPGALSFHGRAQRREWLVGFFVNALFAIVIGALSSIGPVLALPWIAATIAVTTRRLHDLGHPGWWQIVPQAGIALLVLSMFADLNLFESGIAHDAGGLLVAVSIVGTLAMWCVLGIKDGDAGPNVYGEVA